MHIASRFAGFDRALETYLQANCSRNLSLLERTTAPDDELCVTLPSGVKAMGRSAALRAKKLWFEQPQWRMAAKVAWTMELTDTAMAIANVTYSDADERGLPRDRRFLQVLVFRKDADEWKAVAELSCVEF